MPMMRRNEAKMPRKLRFSISKVKIRERGMPAWNVTTRRGMESYCLSLVKKCKYSPDVPAHFLYRQPEVQIRLQKKIDDVLAAGHENFRTEILQSFKMRSPDVLTKAAGEEKAASILNQINLRLNAIMQSSKKCREQLGEGRTVLSQRPAKELPANQLGLILAASGFGNLSISYSGFCQMFLRRMKG